ncbi:MAG: energy-coupling factor ABC transporter permease [Anaerolineales bacterium]
MLFSPTALHIPDGFLSVLLSIVLWVISMTIVAYALRRVGKDLGERQVPLMGLLAAGIFAGQMLNFTVIGGTSGHLMGAAIATILMGPWAAILIMTSVVSIQALVFQDGGLLVLGANIFNMAIVGVTVAYMAYRTVILIAGKKKTGVLIAGFMAAWLSIEIAALSVAIQLAISNTSPANLAIPAMAGVHALIGIGEGLITVGALAFLLSARPDLLQQSEAPQVGSKMVWLVGLLVAVSLVIASPLASTNPDGLEWVAMQNGFLVSAQEPMYRIIPDYLYPGISNEALATIVAGILGIVIVFGVSIGVAYTRRNRQTSDG